MNWEIDNNSAIARAGQQKIHPIICTLTARKFNSTANDRPFGTEKHIKMTCPETSVAAVIGTIADVMTLFGVSGFFTWSFVKKATEGKPLPEIGVAIFAYSIKVFLSVVVVCVLSLLAYGLHFSIILFFSGQYGGADGLWNPQKTWSYVFAYFMTGVIFIPFISLAVCSIFVWSFRPIKDLWISLKINN